jgi:hypothetical protein
MANIGDKALTLVNRVLGGYFYMNGFPFPIVQDNDYWYNESGSAEVSQYTTVEGLKRTGGKIINPATVKIKIALDDIQLLDFVSAVAIYTIFSSYVFKKKGVSAYIVGFYKDIKTFFSSAFKKSKIPIDNATVSNNRQQATTPEKSMYNIDDYFKEFIKRESTLNLATEYLYTIKYFIQSASQGNPIISGSMIKPLFVYMFNLEAEQKRTSYFYLPNRGLFTGFISDYNIYQNYSHNAFCELTITEVKMSKGVQEFLWEKEIPEVEKTKSKKAKVKKTISSKIAFKEQTAEVMLTEIGK